MRRALPILLTALLAPAAVAQQLDELAAALNGDNARARQEAVRALAARGGAEAWGLVLGALADPEPRVADEAQLRLGELADAAILPALLGRDGLAARRDEVALRAAEALGRVELELDPEPLLRALDAKEPELRRTLLWTLERQARAGRLTGRLRARPWSEVEKLWRKEREPGVRAAALPTLFTLSPEQSLRPFQQALEDDAAAVRAAAALTLAEVPIEARAGAFTRLAGDPSVWVRTRVVNRLGERGDLVAALALVDRLEAEPEERLTWTIVGHLQALSGLKHGRDVRPWRDWVKSLPGDWTAGERSAAREYGTGTSAFVGLPVLSRRVVFLIDLSGSMWEPGAGGRTRKEAVDEEIARLLESLPPDTEFNLIPYTDRPLPWEDELVSAAAGNVKKASADFEGQKARGKGNFWDAFLLALEDERVDTVMVLTDGAPTGGRRWNLELMASLLEEQNRFRNVVLDAVLFDASRFLQDKWRTMCALTGGRMHAVEL